MISFTVKGEPIPKGSTVGFLKNWPYKSIKKQFEIARRILNKNWRPVCDVRHSSKHLKAWEKETSKAAEKAMQAFDGPFRGPIIVYATFFLERPQDHFIGKKKLKERLKEAYRNLWPMKAPDLDKTMRAINDAMTEIVYVDDKQVVGICTLKKYGVRPGVRVKVFEARFPTKITPEQLHFDFDHDTQAQREPK